MTEPEEPGTPPPEGVAFAEPEPASEPVQPTAPVTVRPSVRPRRSGPLTRMGPWAPVAGGLLGVALAIVAVLLLGGRGGACRARLSLVFLVVGMGLLGASGTLLADEVRMLR